MDKFFYDKWSEEFCSVNLNYDILHNMYNTRLCRKILH